MPALHHWRGRARCLSVVVTCLDALGVQYRRHLAAKCAGWESNPLGYQLPIHALRWILPRNVSTATPPAQVSASARLSLRILYAADGSGAGYGSSADYWE